MRVPKYGDTWAVSWWFLLCKAEKNVEFNIPQETKINKSNIETIYLTRKSKDHFFLFHKKIQRSNTEYFICTKPTIDVLDTSTSFTFKIIIEKGVNII